MTSKEALEHIINIVSDDTYYKDRLEEEFETLQEDLEVLDILKKLFTLEYDVDFYLNRIEAIPKKMIISRTITSEELKKIEEWVD